MNIYQQSTHKFQKIWTIHIDTLNLSDLNIPYHLSSYIPIKWQLILMSDGSFTQNLVSLTGKIIHLRIIDYFIYNSSHNHNHIREVILKNSRQINLTFARSSWPVYLYNISKYSKLINKPIGQSLIETKIDIYKEIHEIYYGYCKSLERQFQFNGPIWGRRYTIYHKAVPLTTIDEVFSKEITHLFT